MPIYQRPLSPYRRVPGVPAWLVRTGRPAPARFKPYLGPMGLPARPLTPTPETALQVCVISATLAGDA